MATYRIHYETYIDVEAKSQEEAIELASEPEFENDLLSNIQYMDIEEI